MAITKLVISGADSKTISLAHKAESTSVVPDDNITATNVQSALEQLDDIKAPKASPTFTGTVTASSLAATAIDVTGTIVGDGLTVSSATANVADLRRANNTGAGQVLLGNSDGYARLSGTNGSFDIFNSGNTAQRFGIANNGDISFYEDTGATAKLFWDASEESLGIGTTSPDSILTIDKDVSTAFDSSSDSAQRSNTNTLLLKNEDGTANSFAQIAFDLGASNQPIARIAGINTGTSSSALAFVVEGSNVKREAMRIDSSGNVGIGTTSPSAKATIEDGDFARLDLNLSNATGTTIADVRGLVEGTEKWRIGKTASASDDFTINVGSTERMRIDDAGNVGIGTSSPDSILHAHKANAGADTAIMLENSGQSGTSTASLVFTGNGGTGQEKARIKSAVYGDGYMAFHTNDDTEKMRIDSSGNVGIGTDDPQRELEVSGTGNVYVKVTAPTASDSAGLELANTGATWLIQNDDTSSEALTFDRAGTEVMRIDASGNVLVGKTSTAFGTAGSVSYATGLLTATVDGNACVQLNRLTSDGVIQTFGKNGTTVGSIGTFASDLTIGTTDVGVRFDDNASAYIPWNTTSNSATDATIDLGASTVRYKDLYRSGSTYSTSDRNKKQDIRDLTDAEARVAVVAKGSLKAFRYIDTVEAEGDDANIHFGIIAQDLKAAFEAEGLNADSYQVLKTSTYIDDDGVEQTTYSVCYENLLAFIISAI